MQSNNKLNQIVLAIDYGLERVGLAVSQAGIATPLTVIKNDQGLLGNISRICQEQTADLILVGISEQTMADHTRSFIQQLKLKLDYPIETADETLSSQKARQKLKQRGKKSKLEGPIDHYAAAVFLQDWLDL